MSLSGILSLPKARPGWFFAASVVALVAALGVATAWRRRRARRFLVRVGTVSGLFIYPVKSCRGVAVKHAEVTQLGLRCGGMRDR